MSSATISDRNAGTGKPPREIFPPAFPTPLVWLFAARSFGSAAEPPPNVALIIADDLGDDDVGCDGAMNVQTPNAGRLAAEGRRFTDGHSVSAICKPSRDALLT